MNYCPECGNDVGSDETVEDVATDHYYYVCRLGHKWEETVDKSGEVLHIAPVSEEQEKGGEPT